MKKFIAAVLIFSMGCTLIGCVLSKKYAYGVFLNAQPRDLNALAKYETVVIDAQYFSSKDIDKMHDRGQTVLSYINIGSVEEFRDYYGDYVDLTLSVYENWEDERWVNVADAKWQDFILNDLAPKIKGKGVDGFFVDNTDVYWHYQTNDIFDGVTTILKGLKSMDAYVSINGGDCYVSEYAKRYGNLDGIMDAENQETVFSKIDWDSRSFDKNESSERDYFEEYVEMVDSYGKDVYLLEYTTDPDLIEDIDEYCRDNGFTYYAASTVNLEIPAREKGAQDA